VRLKTDPEESIHGSPDLTKKLSHGNGVALGGLVTNWDLALELLITRPLIFFLVNKSEFSKGPTNKGHTHNNPDMCGRLLTQRGEVIRMPKVVLAIN
jgi:hypothetical protein